MDCVVCTRPTADSNLCHSCTDELKTALRSVPWLVEQLEITLVRLARLGQRNGPRGAETPLPYHHRAAVDLETLDAGLLMWAQAVADQRGIVVDGERSAAGSAAWLLRWVGEVGQHPDAGELHGDVMAMVKAGERTVDLPPVLHFLGPCDSCHEDLYCSTQARDVTCKTPDCGAVYQVEERRIWLLEQAVDQLRTAAELSRELPWIAGVAIDRKLVNKWASRDQVTKFLPHPRDPRGHPRFRVGEILELARQTAIGRAARSVAS